MAAIASSHATPRSVGELCIGGDWARADGDSETLRHVAQQLASSAGEPLRCDLMKLAGLCIYDHDRASGQWDRLKRNLIGWRTR